MILNCFSTSNKPYTSFYTLPEVQIYVFHRLNDSNINCPKPLKNKDGKYLIKLKNKTACIVTFLPGKDKKALNLKNCYDVGKAIAQMHLSTNKIKLFRKNSMSIKNLNSLLKSLKFNYFTVK